MGKDSPLSLSWEFAKALVSHNTLLITRCYHSPDLQKVNTQKKRPDFDPGQTASALTSHVQVQAATAVSAL